MKIRKATKKDFKKIAKLIREEYVKHYNEKWTEKNASRTLEYYSGVGRIFLAQEGKELIGFVIVREEYYNSRKALMVEELIVDGQMQGKGVGRQIMDFVEQYCKKKKIKLIWLLTSKKAKAFGFYKKIGYNLEKDMAYFSKELK